MKVIGKKGEYEVGDKVAENARFRLYNCFAPDGRELLFQVATTSAKNGEVARGAWTLTRLKQRSDEVEKEYAEKVGKGHLNYELGFPELIDSFVERKKQVNVLGFRMVPSVKTMVPLVKIWKDELRVDLKTSAWIAGKIYKIMSFAHDHRIQIGKVNGNNILIEPDQHYVVVFDWSESTLHDKNVPAAIRREEVKTAAEVIIKALGGDLERALDSEQDKIYTSHLRLLATNGMSNALKAHESHYQVIDALCGNPDSDWKPGFYKFTTKEI